MSQRRPIVPGIYGDWVVVGPAGRDSGGRARCASVCSACGKAAVRDWYSIRVGTSKGCDCRHTTHGKSRVDDPTYASWQAMRTRCLNPTSSDYPQYGGRGITICREWDAFERFLADMGARPAGHTLDRREVDGPYSPSNCRWATAKVQRANQRPHKRSVYVEDCDLGH